jgi:hypothetical protein
VHRVPLGLSRQDTITRNRQEERDAVILRNRALKARRAEERALRDQNRLPPFSSGDGGPYWPGGAQFAQALQAFKNAIHVDPNFSVPERDAQDGEDDADDDGDAGGDE